MRIAVCGWDDGSAEVLRTLEAAAGLRAVAVGESHPSALVRARAATGLPCYQHVREMLRSVQYEAALIASTSGGEEVAELAAERGAAVLLLGPPADGNTLIEATEATLRHHAPFVLMQPILRGAGLSFFLSLAAADGGWRPRFLDLSVAGTSAARLGDAAAIAGRLMSEAPTHVLASYLGDEPQESPAIAAELRYADGRLASLRARTGTEACVVLYADCALGTVELASTGGESILTMTMRDGSRETSRLPHGDTLALEAARAVEALRGEGGDAQQALRDGVVRAALDHALESGDVVPVERRSSRANLRVLNGRGEIATPPSGHLRLVGV